MCDGLDGVSGSDGERERGCEGVKFEGKMKRITL